MCLNILSNKNTSSKLKNSITFQISRYCFIRTIYLCFGNKIKDFNSMISFINLQVKIISKHNKCYVFQLY